jgi:hypothetical protein
MTQNTDFARICNAYFKHRISMSCMPILCLKYLLRLRRTMNRQPYGRKTCVQRDVRNDTFSSHRLFKTEPSNFSYDETIYVPIRA